MIKELEFLCKYTMPKSWQSTCNEFVDSYGPKIIDYLIQDIHPDVVCSLIELCPEKSISHLKTKHRLMGAEEKNFFQSLTKHSAVNKNYEMPCVVCQFVVQFLSNQMQIDRTEAVLEIAVKNICQLTPQSYKSYCKSLIDANGNQLVKLIDTFTNPQDVCHAISKCDVAPNKIESEVKTELIDLQPAKPINLHKEKYNELFSVQTGDSKNQTLECQLCVS